MRRFVVYAALALHVFGIPATAGERFGQWSLEPQGEGIFALSFQRSIPTQDGVGRGNNTSAYGAERTWTDPLLARSGRG